MTRLSFSPIKPHLKMTCGHHQPMTLPLRLPLFKACAESHCPSNHLSEMSFDLWTTFSEMATRQTKLLTVDWLWSFSPWWTCFAYGRPLRRDLSVSEHSNRSFLLPLMGRIVACDGWSGPQNYCLSFWSLSWRVQDGWTHGLICDVIVCTLGARRVH